MQPTYRQAHSRRRLSGLALSVLLALIVGGGWLLRQDISDWYRLRKYQPTAEIAALSEQTTMTDEGQRIFYTAHPAITDKQAFNAHCRQGSASEYSIVLGCYIGNGGLYGDIYLYDIDDQRLNGVVQVTAGHEMLHAAYDRLKGEEKDRIDALLQDTYRALPEGRVKQAVAQYEANDPGAVPNELHSILGTELRTLPAPLEDYYRQYFADRQKIVGFSEQYEAEFTRRQNQVARYDDQLTNLKTQIESNQRDIDSRRSNLEQQRAQLEALESSGDAEGFNSRVGAYNQGVASYNALVAETRTLIEEHNRLVEVRNNLALEVQELTKAIDSRPQTL